MDEEAFYIISGQGIVRTGKGNLAVKAGDVITFPPGESGAHAISNPSKTQKLVYIDFDTHNLPEITHFPDSHEIHAQGPFSSVPYDEAQGRQNPNRRTKLTSL